ncbi:MAG: hypothetical protein NXY59_03390 [Aigarchaeota archaeon]|nr:hypothetical protein [Candidatus Pelearchaeum maunauluense]
MIQAVQQQIDKVLERPYDSWLEYLHHFLGRFILSSITPGAGYLGIWPRDAAFILYGWLALGEYERGLNACSEIWMHRIRESSLIVAGRSRNTFVPYKIAGREFKKRFQGILPTTILKACP